jgi:threonylcarbamoyladenosine tRNA methylthiotransferase MtaB
VLNVVSSLASRTDFEELPLPRSHDRARAFLKIEDGCDQFCSYCIVPFARGPVRSLRPELAVRRLEELVAGGFREIVLTGVHTSAYGRDLADGSNLASLLRMLLEVPGEFRLRLSSVEPAEVSDELVDVLASPRICRHLHLPLQSGDDEILALMRRPYRTAAYRGLFLRVQERLPGVAVAADVMVGFPGETGLRFENSYRFLASLPLRDLHVFKYSQRPGTRAAALPDQVPPAVKDERSAMLLRLADEHAAAFAGRFAGTILQVLVERKTAADCWEGLSDNYIRVVFPAAAGDAELQGRLIPVRILKRMNRDILSGEAVVIK